MHSAKHFLLLIVVGGIFIGLGGGTHPLSLGISLAFLGLWLLALPPGNLSRQPGLRPDIPTAVAACWLGLIGWILLSLFRGDTGAEWRLEANYLGIPLGSGASPQPWITIEALLPFLAGSVWFLLAIVNAPAARDRSRCIAWLTVILALLGTGAILAQSFGWRLPWADQAQVFSWFPNRNQTALVFACGSVLSFGLGFDFVRKRRKLPMILCFLGGALLLYALFQTLSKGALLAWGGGTLFLFGALAIKRSGRTWWQIGPAVLLLSFALFIFLGGEGRDRFLEFVSASEEVELASDFRARIYTDATAMISEQPAFGVGLGQFSYVFPQYRNASVAPVTILHPESDWIWWTAELGVIGLAIIITGMALLLIGLRSHDPGDPHRFLRYASLGALVSFLLHSFVDVGAHRLGTVALAALFYALALPRPLRSISQGTPHAASIGWIPWRLGGATLLGLGLATSYLALTQSPRLSAYAHTLEAPSPQVPLQWEPYFRQAGRSFADNPRESRADFRRARFLQPHSSEIALQEGFFLLRLHDQRAAFAAFHTALVRSPDPENTYRTLLSRTARHSEYHHRLRTLANKEPKLIGLYWSSLPQRTWLAGDTSLPSLKKDWSALNDANQKQILERLLGLQPAMVRDLYQDSSPESQQQLWPFMVRALVADGEAAPALEFFHQKQTPHTLPAEALTDQEFLRLQRDLLASPDDVAIGTRLLRAHLTRGSWSQARRLASQIAQLPHAPPDTLYWTAYSLEKEGRPEEAVTSYAHWLARNQWLE